MQCYRCCKSIGLKDVIYYDADKKRGFCSLWCYLNICQNTDYYILALHDEKAAAAERSE